MMITSKQFGDEEESDLSNDDEDEDQVCLLEEEDGVFSDVDDDAECNISKDEENSDISKEAYENIQPLTSKGQSSSFIKIRPFKKYSTQPQIPAAPQPLQIASTQFKPKAKVLRPLTNTVNNKNIKLSPTRKSKRLSNKIFLQ